MSSQEAGGERGTEAESQAPSVERDATALESQPSESAQLGWLKLELGLTATHSLSSSEVPRIGTLGGELSAALGNGLLAWVTAFNATLMTRFEVADVQAKLIEATGRSGVRLHWVRRDWSFATDASLAIAGHRVQSAVTDAEPKWHPQLGGQLGLTLAHQWSKRWAPLVGVRASLFPSSVDLVLHPRGEIGKMPRLWFSGVLGVRFSP